MQLYVHGLYHLDDASEVIQEFDDFINKVQLRNEEIEDKIDEINDYLKEVTAILSKNYIDDEEDVVSYVSRMKKELRTALRNISQCYHDITITSNYLHTISRECKEDVDGTK